jgi:hypothetical protein
MDVVAESAQLALGRVAVALRAIEVQRGRRACELFYGAVPIAVLRKRATGERARQRGLDRDAGPVGDGRCGERQHGGVCGVGGLERYGGGGAIRVGLCYGKLYEVGGGSGSGAFGGAARRASSTWPSASRQRVRSSRADDLQLGALRGILRAWPPHGSRSSAGHRRRIRRTTHARRCPQLGLG